MSTSRRKLDHLMIAVKCDVEGGLSTWFEYVHLIHNAVTELSPEDVSLRTRFLGHPLEAPLIIEGMTGGHPETKRINKALAEAAEELGVAVGVGSQRAALEDPTLVDTFRVVREAAPTAMVIANIGAAQLASEGGVKAAIAAVEMIDADALAVHLNALHELVQPEGKLAFRGLLSRLAQLKDELSVPIIAKETGNGISMEAAKALASAGVDAIDVGGAGGTNWAIIERHRALRERSRLHLRLSETLLRWGIPTAASICEVRHVLPEMPLVASGGVRTGLDAGKAIALGADIVGIALPLLRAAFHGGKSAVIEELRLTIYELRAVMALVGAKTPEELKRAPLVILGPLREWLESRGILSRDGGSLAWRR